MLPCLTPCVKNISCIDADIFTSLHTLLSACAPIDTTSHLPRRMLGTDSVSCLWVIGAFNLCRQSCISEAAVSSARSAPCLTYGMNSAFASAKRQYEEQSAGNSPDGMSEHDRTQIWLKGLTMNKAKQASDPKRVDQLVIDFQQLMQTNGLEVRMQRAGPCQYKLGSHKLSLKVGSNKLLVRCGGGYEDLMSAMEKMPQCTV